MTPLAIDTSNRYFALGYVVIAIALIAIIVYLIRRSRQLHRDLAFLSAPDDQHTALEK